MTRRTCGDRVEMAPSSSGRVQLADEGIVDQCRGRSDEQLRLTDWDRHSAALDSGDVLRALWADRVNRSRDVVKARLSFPPGGELGVFPRDCGPRPSR